MAPDVNGAATNSNRSLYDRGSEAFWTIAEKLKEHLLDPGGMQRLDCILAFILRIDPYFASGNMLRSGAGLLRFINQLTWLLPSSHGSGRSECYKETMEEMQEKMEKMQEVINNNTDEAQEKTEKMQEVINNNMDEMQKKMEKMQKVINKKMKEMQKKMDKMEEEISYINYHNKILLERTKRCECPGGEISLRIGTMWVL
ncbi:uncharacterized protein LOC131221915 [Magnolia sinica]|uniref:uncharacterized protein LOC131221915 n=1 Tax=Magnolia sinica TaxID=86752 RepID=UPI002657D2E0|nr:uncharacterized protein LOC131221915 [Magnolia sinica]